MAELFRLWWCNAILAECIRIFTTWQAISFKRKFYSYGRLSFSLWVVICHSHVSSVVMILFRKFCPTFRYLFTISWDADSHCSLSSSVKRRGTHPALTFDIFNSSAITMCTVFIDASTISEISRTVKRRSSSSNAVNVSWIDVEIFFGLLLQTSSSKLFLSFRYRSCHLNTRDLQHDVCFASQSFSSVCVGVKPRFTQILTFARTSWSVFDVVLFRHFSYSFSA